VLYFPHFAILGEHYGLKVTAFHIGNDCACGQTSNFGGDMFLMGVFKQEIRLKNPCEELICFSHSETMREANTH
jgi:hypothetical protein